MRFCRPVRASVPPPPMASMIAATAPMTTPQNTTTLRLGWSAPRCESAPTTMDAESAPETKKIATSSITRTVLMLANG